jgi:hypothetical protein
VRLPADAGRGRHHGIAGDIAIPDPGDEIVLADRAEVMAVAQVEGVQFGAGAIVETRQ